MRSPQERSAGQLPRHLYVHVPFCASKCAYCDFFSIPDPAADQVAAVFSAIDREIAAWAELGLAGSLATVYFGGGTPSLVPEWVTRSLALVRQRFELSEEAEITAEANPDSLAPQALEMLAEAGVTRVSLGVQSFDDTVLALLGRRHDAQEALEAARRVVGAGLELSIDLIVGVPGEPAGALERTFALACESGARHISAYPLAIEEGTPLCAAVSRGEVTEPDADAQAEAMLATARALAACGIDRYEVASYAAAPETQSRHNIAYWTGAPYIGVGPAAHGMLDAATAVAAGVVAADVARVGARVRYGNAAGIEKWIRGDREIEVLSRDEALREDVMLGFRLARGVPSALVAAAGLDEVVASLVADGLVERTEEGWRTTERGWLLGNEVFARVWEADTSRTSQVTHSPKA